jgi:hypothetical protein
MTEQSVASEAGKEKQGDELPSQDVLLELFNYCPDTGLLIRRPLTSSTPAAFRHNQSDRLANQIAGLRRVQAWQHGEPAGMTVKIRCRAYAVHRIAWKMVHGSIPDGMMIDHKNGNPWDNRLDNLRLATRAQNKQNSRVRCDSLIGLKGVKKNGRGYQARIQVNGRRVALGTFPTPEEAHAVYCKAAKERHGEFARTE